MACVMATGFPSRGMYANTRRVTNPLRPSTPLATGLVPWKSNRSQPSTPASANARCTSGSISFVSMVPSMKVRRSASRGAGVGRGFVAMDRAPFGAPFARAFAARGAPDVIHGAAARSEQPEQLAEKRLVVCAAHAARRHVHGGRSRHLENQKRAVTPYRPVEIFARDALRLTQRDRTREQRRQRRNESARRRRNRLVGLRREVPSGRTEHGFGVRPAPKQLGDAYRFLVFGALVLLGCVGEALDLRIHGITQSEALVPQLGHEFRIEVVVGAVHATNRLEKTQREKRVDRCRHLGEAGTLNGSNQGNGP